MTVSTTPSSMIPTSWRDKLAVINEFKLSNATAVAMFSTTEAELATARSLVTRGLLSVPALSADEKQKWTPIVGSVKPAVQTAIVVATPVTNSAKPVSTTRKQPSSGAKRGRSGTRIISALNAIPTTPQPIEAFIAAHGISKTVLRQSKRFLDTPIKVSIKKDKATGIEMICRKA